MSQLQPGAKLNLGLRILALRKDGYHELETVFYPIKYPCDMLFARMGHKPGLEIVCNRAEIIPENNLVSRIYEKFCSATGTHPDVYASLCKKIPIGAGLGGGSSDAACFLKWLNNSTGKILNNAELAKLAATTGADMPFFLFDRPCIGHGIGDKLYPIKRFKGKGLFIVIVCPDIMINTGSVFRAYDRINSLTNSAVAITDFVSCSPLENIAASDLDLHNDLEKPVFAAYPQLADLKRQIVNLGAIKVAMSGSGSTIFGIFDCRANAAYAAKLLRTAYTRVYMLAMRDFGM